MQITVETKVAAPIDVVWKAYTTPEDIKQWNAASDDWHTTAASVDLRVGGQFSSRMEAKDGSFGFDFAGTYTAVVPNKLLEYSFGDRKATVEFDRLASADPSLTQPGADPSATQRVADPSLTQRVGIGSEEVVVVRVTFDAEEVHSVEQQRDGWQAILNNFARHVERKK